MRRTTFSILFVLKKTKQTADGQAPVYVRVTINGVRCEISLNLKASVSKWNTSFGKCQGNDRLSQEVNKQLDIARVKLMKIYGDFTLNGLSPSPVDIINVFSGRDLKPKATILDLFREHNDRCKKMVDVDMSAATIERYETSYKHTAQFIKHQYDKEDYTIEDINMQFNDYTIVILNEAVSN